MFSVARLEPGFLEEYGLVACAAIITITLTLITYSCYY